MERSSAWGANYYGQATVPTGTFLAAAAGDDWSLALRTDGTLVAWGDPYSLSWMAVPTGTFTAITAGRYHGVARRLSP